MKRSPTGVEKVSDLASSKCPWELLSKARGPWQRRPYPQLSRNCPWRFVPWRKPSEGGIGIFSYVHVGKISLWAIWVLTLLMAFIVKTNTLNCACKQPACESVQLFLGLVSYFVLVEMDLCLLVESLIFLLFPTPPAHTSRLLVWGCQLFHQSLLLCLYSSLKCLH